MTPVEIANTIRAALKRDERPQKEIARLADIHHVNLSQFKAGDRTLPLDSLAALARVLNLEIAVRPKAKRARL